jgi:membrane associated rhomboid family serine protease
MQAGMDEHAGVVIRRTRQRRGAEDLALVLVALDIPHAVERRDDAWCLVVPWAETGRAEETLAAFERESVSRPPAPLAPFTMLGAHVALVLGALFVVTGPRGGGSAWFQVGTAKARAILDGEPWRAVTALTLHADFTHVVGNATIGIVLFGLLGGALGGGVALLFAALAGTGGNLLNAWLRGIPHDAVGASTALFGVVGILSGLAYRRRVALALHRPWLAIAAGLALLAMLGAGEDTDVLAHCFGFLAGIPLGLVARRADAPVVQVAATAGAVGLVGGAWLLAFG